MNCQECAEFLMDYIDGTLPVEQAAAFEGHLQKCPPCIDYLESYKRCIEMGKSCIECKDEMEPPPEHFIEAILNAARKQL